MDNRKANEEKNPVVVDALTDLLRNGARRLIVDAVEAELALFLEQFAEEQVDGKPRLARNGYLPEREILTGIGKISVRLPRLRDRGLAEEKVNFHSGLIPPYIRRSASIDEVLPLLYLNDDRRCALVIIGVNEEGHKELIALEDGFRESTESWLSLLRQLKTRGLSAPKLTIGDGALGFWNAVSEAFPEAKHQRCWFHKMGNVLDKLPKAQQGRAKSMLHEIWMSATRKEAHEAFDRFIEEYGAKYPKAGQCLEKDKIELLAFYDFPAEHWVHLRTTNPIESTFATVRNRTYKAKGAFSNQTILMMAFKLMQSAQKRWRKLKGFHQLDNVLRGIKFIDGKRENNTVGDEVNP